MQEIERHFEVENCRVRKKVLAADQERLPPIAKLQIGQFLSARNNVLHYARFVK
jgi:hypothetical protein